MVKAGHLCTLSAPITKNVLLMIKESRVANRENHTTTSCCETEDGLFLFGLPGFAQLKQVRYLKMYTTYKIC